MEELWRNICWKLSDKKKSGQTRLKLSDWLRRERKHKLFVFASTRQPPQPLREDYGGLKWPSNTSQTEEPSWLAVRELTKANQSVQNVIMAGGLRRLVTAESSYQQQQIELRLWFWLWAEKLELLSSWTRLVITLKVVRPASDSPPTPQTKLHHVHKMKPFFLKLKDKSGVFLYFLNKFPQKAQSHKFYNLSVWVVSLPETRN